MLGRYRDRYERSTLRLGEMWNRLHFKPNFLSLLSVVFGFCAGASFFFEHFILGIFFVIISAFFDISDGASARFQNASSPFGEIIDHIGDRYVEFFLIAGIIGSGHVNPLIAVFTLFGMIMASYTRVKAESKDPVHDYKKGITERQEKLILLCLGCLLEIWFSRFHILDAIVLILGFLSHVTVFQRVFLARKYLSR